MQAANDQDYISISDEPAITPIEDINDVLADGSDSAGEGATGIMHGSFSDGVSSESSEEMDSEGRATDRFVGTDEGAVDSRKARYSSSNGKAFDSTYDKNTRCNQGFILENGKCKERPR